MSTSAVLLLAASGLLGGQETDRLRLDEAEDGLLRKWAEARTAQDGPELLRLYDEACRRHAERLVRPDPDSPVWIPLTRWLARELGQLPSPSRERWELLAREMLDGPADPAARRDAAERFASTQAGRDALFALANDAFDRGEPLAAMRGWARLLDYRPTADVAARLAHAHAVAGDGAGLSSLRARAESERWTGDVAVGGVLRSLGDVLAQAPAAPPPAPARPPPPTTELALGRWDFSADGRPYRSGQAAMMPAWGKVEGHDALFVTNGVRVIAFDPRAADGGSLEGCVLWRHPADGQVRPHGLTWSSTRPTSRPLCGVTADGGRVYALLLSRLPRNSHIQLGHRGNRDSFEGPS
ncbi:MAG TPA: hypothetical protein VEJ18_17305, partial [Planctomycetota bacterium]|nr:hypothetical protein [Planctomycetota bacterium]